MCWGVRRFPKIMFSFFTNIHQAPVPRSWGVLYLDTNGDQQDS